MTLTRKTLCLSILTLSTRKSSGLDNRIVPVSQFSSWNQSKVWKCHEMEKHRLMKLTNKLYIIHIHDHKIKIYREKYKLPDDFSNVYKNARLTWLLTSVLTCTTFPGSGKGLPNAADSNSLARSSDLCRHSSAASNNCDKQ